MDLCSRWVQFIPITSKLASEVLVNLCRFWFHFRDIQEFILSDRGKEFLSVVSSVCALLGIKHNIRQVRSRSSYSLWDDDVLILRR